MLLDACGMTPSRRAKARPEGGRARHLGGFGVSWEGDFGWFKPGREMRGFGDKG